MTKIGKVTFNSKEEAQVFHNLFWCLYPRWTRNTHSAVVNTHSAVVNTHAAVVNAHAAVVNVDAMRWSTRLVDGVTKIGKITFIKEEAQAFFITCVP